MNLSTGSVASAHAYVVDGTFSARSCRGSGRCAWARFCLRCRHTLLRYTLCRRRAPLYLTLLPALPLVAEASFATPVRNGQCSFARWYVSTRRRSHFTHDLLLLHTWLPAHLPGFTHFSRGAPCSTAQTHFVLRATSGLLPFCCTGTLVFATYTISLLPLSLRLNACTLPGRASTFLLFGRCDIAAA